MPGITCANPHVRYSIVDICQIWRVHGRKTRKITPRWDHPRISRLYPRRPCQWRRHRHDDRRTRGAASTFPKSVLFFGGNTSKEIVAVSLFKISLIFIQFFSPFHHLHTFRLRNYPLFSRKKIGRKSCFSSSAVSLAAMTFRIFCIRLSSAALCCAQSYSSSFKNFD